MKTTSTNARHLRVNHEAVEDDAFKRGRCERAASLALPHSSLLDFYDKQQEQCSSVALLPTNVNVVVRRHSAHCYPMQKEKQQHTLSIVNGKAASIRNCSTSSLLTPTASASASVSASVSVSASSQAAHFIFDEKEAAAATATANQLLIEGKKSTRTTTTTAATTTAATMSSVITTNDNNRLTTPALNVLRVSPPPIPKRRFRTNLTRNSRASPTKLQRQTFTKSTLDAYNCYQQQQQQQQHPQQHHQDDDEQQPPPANHFQQLTVHDDCIQTLYGDNVRQRQLYSFDCGGLDAACSSDDDRMSLENSVFDESSATSTPVKSSKVAKQAGGFIGLLAGKAFPVFSNDLSNADKRANRSSSSTVDSSITTTSSGYGSHSERLASTSTGEFRSRFSSVDTESSLDSCLIEKTTDLSLSKDSFKIEPVLMQETMMAEYKNQLNNNETRAANPFGNRNRFFANSNNNATANIQSRVAGQEVPVIPVRKQYAVPPKIQPIKQQQQQPSPPPAEDTRDTRQSRSVVNDSKISVSASTSTSSTASNGTSDVSSSSLSAASGGSAAFNLSLCQERRRPAQPPTPPSRMPGSAGGAYSSVSNNNKSETASAKGPPPLTIRNKLSNKPPPIVYPKLHQRQDSNLSSPSPGYNSSNLMEAPLLSNAARINQSVPGKALRHQEINAVCGTSSRMGGFTSTPAPARSTKVNQRQDSTISSDNFSQNSSPGYNTKLMEAPLLPPTKQLSSVPRPIACKEKLQDAIANEMELVVPLSPLTKCVSTPASLQTIVRFQNGAPNTMSLQHQIVNRRKSSNPYISNGRLNFRFYQILVNAFALLAIAGSLAVFFSAYPVQVKVVNQTIINTIRVEEVVGYGRNPAPGTCLPIIVKFCEGPQIPYNFTVFPNYIGHFGQLETQVDLEAYEALVDVRCYELVSLFLCTLFVPKCGATGSTVPPCKTLCTETMRRCGFFFDVFGLSLPDYLNCNLFKDFESSDECVGLEQVRNVMIAASNPVCKGFQCDQARCIPNDYVCDGHLDCMDQTDESKCERCGANAIYCGENRCMSSQHICDGVVDCPYGQDERNCIRLSERNGDLGKGVLEVFRIDSHDWTPACVKNWDRSVSPTAVCSMLGYNAVNATSVVTQRTHRPLLTSVNVSTHIWKMYAKKRSNLMQEFSSCRPEEDYPIAELTCTNYECGRVRRRRHKPSSRIIGGTQANPGSWPFLAAVLGGPEKIFYCAGVLISDQWVLTASHCIGNHTVIDLEDWTIQLGVTRRNSFTYSGQKVKVKTVIPHPLYNTHIAHDNDIALFQLAQRVSFHEHLLPVCLPPPGLKQIKPDTLCTVIGWGKRQDNDPKATYEPIVNEVQVPVIRRQQCDEWLDNLTVSEGMICAGFEEGGKDACQGDSGGPLLCPYPGERDKWFVGGIVSWGIRCAHPKLPGVYANVVKYIPWILEQIQKHTKPSQEDERISKFRNVPAGGAGSSLNISPGPSPFKGDNNINYNAKQYSSNTNRNRSPMDVDY